jgi:hypothetical protein
MKASPLPPAPAKAWRLSGLESWKLYGSVSPKFGASGGWVAWWLGVLEALKLDVSKAYRFLVLLGGPGRCLGALWELLGAS